MLAELLHGVATFAERAAARKDEERELRKQAGRVLLDTFLGMMPSVFGITPAQATPQVDAEFEEDSDWKEFSAWRQARDAERERVAQEERFVREQEALERAEYKPQPPYRDVIEGDKVVYEAQSQALVQPGATASIMLGEICNLEGTGWPGLPETQMQWFGATADFKPEAIYINEGFELLNVFIGVQNALPQMPEGKGVPAEVLVPGKPQPEYPVWKKGHSFTVVVKNVAERQRACTARVIGKELAK